MRVRTDMPRSRPRPNGRWRVVLVVAVGVAFLLFTASTEIATFFTEKLWFDSLELGAVWTGIIGARFQLVGIFGVVLTAALWFNLYLADRRAPLITTFGPGDDVFGRYQDVLDRRSGSVRLIMAMGFGLIGGLNMAGQWQQWVLFRNGGDFGRVDATFSEDLGFFVFRLPFLNTVVSWAFAWGVIALLLTGVAYYLNGCIRPQAPFERVTPAAKRHLSLLLVFVVLMKAADYWLQRYELVYSRRSVVSGATYTEMEASLPALQLLTLVSLITAAVIVVSIFRRGFTLPVVSIAGWFLVSLVAGVGYPFFVYATDVKPNTTEKERPYIENNIAATRDGLGLTADRLEVRQFDYVDDVDKAAQAIEDNPGTIRNVSILDPDRLQRTFQNQQGLQNFYKFANLDVDRYPVTTPDGREEQAAVVLGTRNISSSDAPEGWENQTIVYTHGYGAAMSASSGVGQGGGPDYVVRDIPTTVDPRVSLGTAVPDGTVGPDGTANTEGPGFQPAVYFGELADEGRYVLVGATRSELSYVSGTQSVTGRYEGKGGVPLDNFLTRAAFSIRFRDAQLLLSDFVTPETRVIFQRDVQKRLENVAPFISWDSNPYPVLAGGRTVYMVDGYTLTNRMPNAEPVAWEGTDVQRQNFNYVRNSVKATVDAYDGTVKVYVWDQSDPIVAAWQTAFPELFSSVDSMPSALRSHVRYPEDLFKVQTAAWGRYRLDNADEFYQFSGGWSVAQKPSEQPQESAASTTTRPPQAPISPGPIGQNTIQSVATSNPIDPNYALLTLPNQTKESFNIMRSFVPVGAGASVPEGGVQTLSGFMFAQSDPDNYGKLIVYEMPTARPVDGPKLIDNLIITDQRVTSLVSLLDVRGSEVTWGSMILVPVGDGSLLWVRPMYVTPNFRNNPQAVPVLQNLIVVYGKRVVMKPTLREAVREIFGQDLRVETYETGGGLGDSDPTLLDGSVENPGSTTTTTAGANGGSSSTSSTTAGSTEPPGGSGDAQVMFRQAEELLVEAEAALAARDLNRYIELVEQAQAKIAEANRLSGVPTTSAPPPEPSPTTAVPVAPA